jgi:predicted RNA binding protein YcfA (HicA-like mRNA interferase family)
MLTNSQDIKRRLEREGWVLRRMRGSHHVFKRDGKIIVLPHPKKDWAKGSFMPFICRRDGNRTEGWSRCPIM